MFWLSYECFSILCDAFLLKSVISSHNSCKPWTHACGEVSGIQLYMTFENVKRRDNKQKDGGKNLN